MKRLSSVAMGLALVAAGFFAGVWVSWRASGRTERPGTREVLYWVDPMHPAYKSEKPGIAPDCGMALEPVYAGESVAATGSSVPPGALRVSPETQQTIGVQFALVGNSSVTRTIRTVGRVAVDDDRVYRLVATVDGIVRELHPNAAGSFVRRDQVLLTYYSSEFLGAQQAYFYALNTRDRIGGDKTEPTEQMVLTNAQLRSAVDTMRNLGMSEVQIRELGRTRRLVRDVELRSPVSGYVLSRSVFPEERLERGSELYRIADLSRLWVFADLFESDAHYVRAGTVAEVSFPSRQGVPMRTRISNVLPQLDPTTRTLKVRLDIDNPDMALRPDMFVDVEISATLPAAVTVPADAVVDSGLRKVVFVDRGSGTFEPRRVETGWRSDDRVEIVKGLMPGERIVVSGNFLLDSESRMKAAAMGIVTAETDPVCGMEVDQTKAKTAGRTSVHRGASHFFCSDSCKKRFDASPERFVPGAGAPSPSPSPPRRGVSPPRVEVRDRPDETEGRAAEYVREADSDLNTTSEAAGGRTIFATDPVCGAEVEMTAPDAIKAEHEGRTWYFVTAECRDEFLKDPARYASAPGAAAPRPPADPARPDLSAAKDVVCGMDVDAKQATAAGLFTEHEGRTYYFCTEECKERFGKEPRKYLKE
jgi:membrane fusion protein, copper/silver efflux system